MSLGIRLAFQPESHISLTRWAFADAQSPVNPQILSSGRVFHDFEAYVDFQSTVGFNLIITHMQIHSYPERAGIKEVALLFLQKNWGRIWDVINVVSSPLCPWRLLQDSTANLPNSWK